MPKPEKHVQLPKNALSKVSMGQSFAEYDPLLSKKQVFVTTVASQAAATADNRRCFYIGRRGTGKTAITLSLAQSDRVTQIHPEIFAPLSQQLVLADLTEMHQKPFKSLTTGFGIALLVEVARLAHKNGAVTTDDLPSILQKEIEANDVDFDLRASRLIANVTKPLLAKKDAAWLKQIKRFKTLSEQLDHLKAGSPGEFAVIVDRIDESWDGTTENIIFLAAFMHACVQVTNRVSWGRVLLFLRENVFERVRAIDSEFARLETSVVGLEWTPEKLLELVERRLMAPFNTKLPLGGETWDQFFEDPDTAWQMVLDSCQHRPRDLITYCGIAIDTALSANHRKVQLADLLNARKRFSDSRLKDLCDEYDENYPQIQLVLNRFYGLGYRYTLGGIDNFLKKILLDDQVKTLCAQWIFRHTVPQQFARLLYDVGFFGISNSKGEISFRSMGPKSTTAPGVGHNTDFEIHPAFRDSLDLQDTIIGGSDEEIVFTGHGLVPELPGCIDLSGYIAQLDRLEEDLKSMPMGPGHASQFEDLVGDVIKLCFFRALTNVQPRVRDANGCTIRDWVASNSGSGGFWELVRHKYGAIQIIWECKNYANLKSDDFQQVSYYMNEQVGRFAIVVFRGEIKDHDWDHLSRVSRDKNGLILLLNTRDLLVFIRQARKGKVKDAHIQDRFDQTVRKLA